VWIYDPEQRSLVDDPTMDTSGTGGAATPAPANVSNLGAANAQNPNAPTSSGQFTDIGKYLNLNQDQAAATGQKVVSGVENQINQAQQGTQQIQQQFDQAIGQAGPRMSSEEIKSIANPQGVTDFVKDQNNVTKFQDTLSGQYKGPQGIQDLTGYDELYRSFDKLNKIPDQIDTVGGRQELIKGVYNRPERAKQGMLDLDEALVRQTPEAIEPIRAQAQRTPEIQEQFNKFQQNAASKIADTRQAVSNRGQEARNAFLGEGGFVNQFDQGLNDKVGQVQNDVIGGANMAKNLLDVNWLKSQGILSDRDAPTLYSERLPSDLWRPRILNEEKLLSLVQSPQGAGALRQMGVSEGDFLKLMQGYSDPDKYYAPEHNNLQTALAPRESQFWSGLSDFSPYSNIRTPDVNTVTRDTVASNQDYDVVRALEKLLGDNMQTQILGKDNSLSGQYANDFVDLDYYAALNQIVNRNLAPKYAPGDPRNGVK
jgi:ubiquinone biosynthesis protein UbiJ